MKKNLIFMALSLLLSAGFATSCSDEEPAPVPEESLLIGFYTGTAVGSSQHFQGMLSTSPDTVFVSAGKKNSSLFDVEFRSEFWGNATFQNVQFQKENGVYRLADTEGTIAMPRRQPGAEVVTYSNYPATLKGSTLQMEKRKVTAYSFTIEADLGERAGTYTLVLE